MPLPKKTKTTKLCVTGTHCRSCEILIEKEISSLPGVKSVSASSQDGHVIIKHDGSSFPKVSKLNKLFHHEGYVFSKTPQTIISARSGDHNNSHLILALIISLLFLSLLYFLSKLGIIPDISVTTDSLPIAFAPFGLVAGFSTCAALVGGLVLSLSTKSNVHPAYSSLAFNFGRLVSFTLLGALLGYFGNILRLSLGFGSFLTILASLLMLILGMGMLNFGKFANFSFSLPKSLNHRLISLKWNNNFLTSFSLGAVTFFLPCGFTLTAQSLALASGNPLTGAQILFFFALGTALPLFLIGISGSKISANRFGSQVVGFLIIFFAFFNLYNQSKVLGINLISSGTQSTNQSSEKQKINLPPVVDGKQVIKMSATSSGYAPNKFVVKKDIPVRWEITDRGTSGCTNAVISRGLFKGPINLVPGTTSVKEFTPTKSGNFQFSCWMGMINGDITVVD